MYCKELFQGIGIANTTMQVDVDFVARTVTNNAGLPAVDFVSPMGEHEGQLPDELVVLHAPIGGPNAGAASIPYRDLDFNPTLDVQAWTWPADASEHHVFLGRGSQPGTSFSRNIGGGSPILPRGRFAFPPLGIGIQASVRILAYWYGKD